VGITIRTTDGSTTNVDRESLEQLGAALRGKIALPESPEYETSRTLWNRMIDRRPAAVVRCASPDDVARSIRLAVENRLLLSVRGGGHNIGGNACVEGGLMLDLSPMSAIAVDPASRTAHVEGGATLGMMDAATQRFGLATPLGINSTTGVAGLTLGGGFGWLSRRYGLTIDNLRSAEVVLANGTRVRASAEEEPELFWAIRGGGGNFGVVTSFEFQLHEIGTEVLSGLIVHPLEDAPRVLRFWRDYLPGTPESFVCWFVMRKAPPLPFLPEEWHGREILALAAFNSGDLAEGERIMKPLRDFGNPIADVIAPTPYTGWQQVLDPLLAPGERNYWKSHDFAQISDGLIDTFTEFGSRIPDPQTEIALAQLGGAVSRVPRDATAYTHRDGEFVLNVHGRWHDAEKDDHCVAWARELFNATAKYSTGGGYVNFLTQDETDRVRAVYGSNYERLVAAKNRYDASNLFRMNHNIVPTSFELPETLREGVHAK
jgi:FAD/FMN-containing dehydrogenase